METAILGIMISYRITVISVVLSTLTIACAACAQRVAPARGTEGQAPTAQYASPAQATRESSSANAGSVSQQFSRGADHVSKGATQIGQGIANGAEMTWDAMKAGANAFSKKITGDSSGG